MTITMLPAPVLRIRVRSAQLFLWLVAFAAAGAVFLYFVGQDALNGRNTFQFFADSNTYHQIYDNEFLSFDGRLVGISANYVGPLLVLTLVRGNIYLVMLLNVCVLFWSIVRTSRLLHIDPLTCGALLMISPMTISSLLSVNKEIFIFPFIALALSGYVRGSFGYLLGALLVSVLFRWQLTLFCLVMLALSLPVGLLRRRRLVIAGLLVGASALYVALAPALAPVLDVVERSNLALDYDPGSGLFTRLLDLQSRGLYFLVFPAKALHLLFAMGLRVGKILHPGNIYNDVFVALHCAATLVLCLLLMRRRAFRLDSDLIYASVIFLVIFCLSPIYAPRYLYPVFVAWTLVVTGAPDRLSEVRRPDLGYRAFGGREPVSIPG